MSEEIKDTGIPEKTPGHWRRALLNRWLLAGVSVVVLYALIGFFLTPWIVTRYINNYALEKLKRKASIAEVRVNPFLFTFEAKDFVLEEADNRPIFGFDRLFVDFQVSSLFHWAWTFAEVRIEQPSLYVEIQDNGRLNFADLADSFPQPEDPPATESRPPRVFVRHAEVIGGSFTFSDRSDLTHAQETFWPLNLKFNEISTIPERKGPYIVKADLPGGGTVGWQGEISLHPIFSEGKLSITGFKMATAWKFAQDELNIAEPEGEMDFNTRYRFDYQNRVALLVLQDAQFALKKLLLTEKGKNTPILALKAIEAHGIRFDLQAREFMVPYFGIRDGKVSASVNEEGFFDWQKLISRQESTNVTVPMAGTSIPENPPWRLNAEKVSVENVKVDYSDHSRVNPIEIGVDGLNVVLKASAEVGIEPVKAIVKDLELTLNGISISETGDNAPFLSLDTLALDDGRIDIVNREVTIPKVGVTGGGTSMLRGGDGKIRLIEILNPGDKGRLKRDVAKTAEKAKAEGKPWSVRLDVFQMKDFKMSLEDHTVAPVVKYDLTDIRASLKNLTNDGKTPIDFNADLKVAQGGSVGINGQVSQVGDHADARVKITGINLKPLGPAVDKFTLLELESGNISASVKVKYRSTKSGPQLRSNGSLNLNNLMLSEKDTGERFLEWKEISANGLTFGLSPDHMNIEEMRLVEPGAKIVIFKDRSVNLAKVLKRSNPVGTETATSVTERKAQELFPLKIERIRVEKGIVDFADFGLVLPFSTHVTDLNGGATGISSDPASRTSVKLEGKVDEYGFSTVEGGLSPFAPKTFTDLTVLFQNVEMKPLSPYSATFAGRKIASGTLNLKLEYKIQNSELRGDNEVVLEEFTLGDRVEAPNAINLPLDLAIALLTDTEGKIDVAVPVSGDVDDPKFSYGHVIRQALVNLITKIVTAPFRALGGLFGDKGEPMDAISFQPGNDRLLPPELKKLKQVADALIKRPRLRLVVHGRFDTKIDGEALRTERVKLALAQEMGVKLSADQDPGPVAFNTAKTQKALEKLLKIRSGEKAVAEFKIQYEKKTGQKAKRVKPYLAIFGLESSDIVFYQAIFNELVKLEPMMDNDLQDLAHQRAKAIIEELRNTGRLKPERVSIGSTGPVEKASNETVNTELSLDVIKPAA